MRRQDVLAGMGAAVLAGCNRPAPARSPATVAAGRTGGNNMCVNRDSPLPSDELLNRLRRIADHDDAPDTVQADARDYLRYLEAASSGSGALSGEARLNMAASVTLHFGCEVAERLPQAR